MPLVEPAQDVADDVHDVAVALHGKAFSDAHRADLGDAAHVVAAEIQQHQVLGALLGIGQQLLFERLVLFRRGAAPPRAGERPDRHLAVAHTHQDLGRRTDQGERSEIEVEQEWGRIGAPERAVEGEGGQREGRGIALGQHDLEYVAGGDVLLGPLHHRHELLGRGVGDGLRQRQRDAGHARCVRQRFVEGGNDAAQPLHRGGVGRVRVDIGLRIDWGDDDHLVLDRVEHDHDGRSHEDAVGDGERVGSLVGEALDQPHGIVAHVADDAGGNRRQVARQLDARLRQECAQRLQGRELLDLEGLAVRQRLAVDLGPVAEGAPDDVRSDADDGVASAHGAALHRFQETAHGLPIAQLQGGGDRRLEVGDEPRPHDLG